MIHNLSDVQSKKIGSNTSVWQFTTILPNAQVGKNCNICANCFIENDVFIGDNVTIKNGVFLWDGIIIEDSVQIGPSTTFTNDKYPRAKHDFVMQKIIIKKHASIGANCTVLGGVCIGEKSMIGAGSLVTKSVPPGELWYGSPAKFIKKI